MPDNAEDKIQLVHFNTLELVDFTMNDPYNLQGKAIGVNILNRRSILERKELIQ